MRPLIHPLFSPVPVSGLPNPIQATEEYRD